MAGAALAFSGFLIQGFGWMALLWSFGLTSIAAILLAVGNILAAVGFFLAFLGLARHRAGP